jgi:hypothetical protein
MVNMLMDVRYSQSCLKAGPSPLCTANGLFAQARKRARQGQFWSRLTGRSQGLFALKQVRAACTVQAMHDGGVRTVPINQIRGSEGRSHYFDLDFNPLYDQTRGRWLSIAVAQQQGKALPPVSLIQVGDLYFVQDGHHRISVARARGQTAIEARVIVWQVSGPLPWETLAQAPHQATPISLPKTLIGKVLRRELVHERVAAHAQAPSAAA